jgi:hypothetical protein
MLSLLQWQFLVNKYSKSKLSSLTTHQSINQSVNAVKGKPVAGQVRLAKQILSKVKYRHVAGQFSLDQQSTNKVKYKPVAWQVSIGPAFNQLSKL